ncbi:endoglucanase [Pseudobutyrivibrio sp. NOR37]|uniref:cellulase n=1 Tax=Pseudobutyrivibrio xylanivorans TaxID=185007 RepID=A0A6M0LKC9_PSEXY|nr:MULTISPECIES: glycoside hydrolase family 5 protein [Pseudobutyrivibrio]NEX02610.1 glycoside hydrolase family 5 protein [Pseudobutyrivibrio xylanivorans]SFR82105.1 endoglucanase [Pseudobutyrivibrio sp. NOR37]
MVSKKKKFGAFIFAVIFSIAIVGGIFGVCYYKGIVSYPWQIKNVTSADNTIAFSKEETVSEPEEVVVEEKPEVKPSVETEETKPEPETTVEEPETTEEEQDVDFNSLLSEDGIANTGVKLDYYGALSVSDGKLVDSHGKEVQLTGISTHGINWFPEFAAPETIASLRNNFGINVIRLAMYTSDYNGYCVGGSDNQKDLMDKICSAVDAATENDMYVIIDWHTLNDENPNTYKAESIQFFGEMVRKYKGNDNVIYEICNEPNGDTTWSDIKSYAKEVIPVIRNVDSDAVILVGTPEWSSDLESVQDDPLNFKNIMYTYHFYAASHKDDARAELESALEAGLPVFISEYGLVSADGNGSVDTKEAKKWYDLIDEYKLSSCIWNLSNKDEGSALISADCQSTLDWKYEDLSDEGKYFFDKLSEGNKTGNDN